MAIYGLGANLSTGWLLVVLAGIAAVIVMLKRSPGKPNPELLPVGADTPTRADDEVGAGGRRSDLVPDPGKTREER